MLAFVTRQLAGVSAAPPFKISAFRYQRGAETKKSEYVI
jgi:hypothetical protein